MVIHRVINRFSTGKKREMLISENSSALLQKKLQNGNEVFCSGLFLSARWAVLSQVAKMGTHLVILPTRESAEYCSADLYNMVEGDCVFFLPESGKSIERSNYKSSLGVQRTAAVGKLLGSDGSLLYIVTYPEALEEKLPSAQKLTGALLTLKVGDEISHDALRTRLIDEGFEKVDFVSAPGQFAMRGAVIDIFSYSLEKPYRINFFGNEIDKINTFDCNTQLSVEQVPSADIYPDIAAREADGDDEGGQNLIGLLPSDTTVWLDSSDMYRDREFFPSALSFRHVFLDIPLQKQDVPSVKFNISPQPVFNKSFELLLSDIRTKVENSFKVYIFGEKESQLERLRSIMLQEENAVLPEFVKGKNIHAGFVDNEDKVCWYTDHEIFDRFHRVRMRRTVEKSEQLTINDLSAFNLGDFVVHIDHGVGIFGGLVKMKDDFGRVHEVVKLMYHGGDVVFVSVHSLHKISRFRSKEGEAPRINKLGSKTWSNLKSAAKSRVKDIAKELI